MPSFKIVQLATPHIDDFASYGITSVYAYAHHFGYDHFVQRDSLLPDMHINWSKIELIRTAMDDDDADYIVLVDADINVINFNRPLDHWIDLHPEANIYMPQDTPLFKPNQPNAGFIIVKNNAIGKEIIKYWLHAAKHEGAHLADTHPRNQLVYWNFVMPKFRQYQQLIPRRYVPKYLSWRLTGNLRGRFLYHVTQSDNAKRKKIMMGLLTRYCDNHSWHPRVLDILRHNEAGLVKIDIFTS